MHDLTKPPVHLMAPGSFRRPVRWSSAFDVESQVHIHHIFGLYQQSQLIRPNLCPVAYTCRYATLACRLCLVTLYSTNSASVSQVGNQIVMIGQFLLCGHNGMQEWSSSPTHTCMLCNLTVFFGDAPSCDCRPREDPRWILRGPCLEALRTHNLR